jgi:hypothetical protein
MASMVVSLGKEVIVLLQMGAECAGDTLSTGQSLLCSPDIGDTHTRRDFQKTEQRKQCDGLLRQRPHFSMEAADTMLSAASTSSRLDFEVIA